ncbi:hypothetical protein TL16_g11475 [Triparma laevis f. inornata]|uniref:START domain-containing protein n=1 Tax=Triparma laevis f. inornata TaxID=1714386 RepID=A0A9W7ETL0_9STRA|nr:hypothetical protein TL16_g11475 [Triparma laevis f. inornata]
MATIKKFPFLLLNYRKFVFRQVCKSEEGKVFIAFESVHDEVDYGTSRKKVSGLTKGLYYVEHLSDRGGARQCRLTLVQTVEFGGSIPTWIVNKLAPQALSAVQDAIDEFTQDEMVDAAERREKATLMREWKNEVYSEEEIALLERVREKFEGSLKEGKGWKKFKSPDIFVEMEATFEERGSTAAIGRAVTVVDATIEDCVAWEAARVTRERMRGHYREGGRGCKVVKLNDHSEIFYTAIDFGVRSFAPREWLTKIVWKMVDKNTMVVGYEDIEDDNFPIGAGKKYVRASSGGF